MRPVKILATTDHSLQWRILQSVPLSLTRQLSESPSRLLSINAPFCPLIACFPSAVFVEEPPQDQLVMGLHLFLRK